MDQTEKYIYDKVCQIIEDVTDTDGSRISPESTLADDLDADSLTLVEIALAIQDEFQISVRDEQINHLTAVSDVVRFIRDAMVTPAEPSAPGQLAVIGARTSPA